MKFSYFMVYVKDIEKNIAFYRDIIGLEVERRYTEDGNIQVAFMVEKGQRPMIDQPMIELVSGLPGESTIQSGHQIGIAVDSLTEMTELMRKNGYEQVNGPFSPEDGYTISEFMGPEGIRIGLMEVDARTAERQA
jgi:lactoylglutathione lyase